MTVLTNFLKSVLPRLTSQPAKDVFESLNIEMLDAQGNMRNVIDLYRDVAKASEDLTRQEQIAVAEGLAGKFQIARMQQFLETLRDAGGMYDQMIQAQQEATNSAIEENEEYLKSFEARLAGARREVEILALALGDAFLSEAMVQGIKVFSDGLGILTKFTETFGALPAIFLVVSGLLGVTTKTFGGLFEAMAFGTSKMSEAKLKVLELDAGMTRMDT